MQMEMFPIIGQAGRLMLYICPASDSSRKLMYRDIAVNIGKLHHFVSSRPSDCARAPINEPLALMV